MTCISGCALVYFCQLGEPGRAGPGLKIDWPITGRGNFETKRCGPEKRGHGCRVLMMVMVMVVVMIMLVNSVQ